MKTSLLKLLAKHLRDIADKIDAGTCELAEDEAIDLVETAAHIGLSADQARSYLNVSRSTFNNLLKSGAIPQGKKVRGFHELRYYRDSLKRHT